MLVLGVDTLEFGIEVENYERRFLEVLKVFDVLKKSAQETGVECETIIGSMTLKVHGSGIPFYSYRLSCADFMIYFADKELPNNTPIRVKFLSGFLWSYTTHGAFESFLKWFEVFESEVVVTKVSRVDVCCDTDEVSFLESDRRSFVTRAKGKARHWADDDHSSGKVFTGYVIGRGQPMLARIYHKGLEVKKSGKAWFHEVWGLHGWQGDVNVWRIEFQLRRGVLKEFGTSSVVEVLDKIDGIWAYCSKEWLTLRRPDTKLNVSRWKIRRKWRKVQSAEFLELTSPLVREKVRQGNLKQLLNQAAGIAVSIAALGNYENLNDTLAHVSQWTENRLMSKNLTFDGEKELRRTRFLNISEDG